MQNDKKSFASTDNKEDAIGISVHSAESPIGVIEPIFKIDIDSLAKNHGKRLYYFVLHKVRNEEDAQDIVQSAYIEAMKSSTGFLGNSKQETWLMGIAVNLIKNHFYKKKLKPTYYLADEEYHDHAENNISHETPACILEKKQLIETIEAIFNSMPEDMRNTARKVLLEGASYEEARFAEIIEGNHTNEATTAERDIPIGTVRSRVSRARTMLKSLKAYIAQDAK
jgi:RNA polymerase sigma factor (sigma-70 family)